MNAPTSAIFVVADMAFHCCRRFSMSRSAPTRYRLTHRSKLLDRPVVEVLLQRAEAGHLVEDRAGRGVRIA
jgi:hypothetical protein